RVDEPTAGGATGRLPRTGRRSPGGSGGSRANSAWRSLRQPAAASWTRASTGRAWEARRSTPTRGRGTARWGAGTGGCTGRWTTRAPRAPGRSTPTGVGVREVHCNTMEGLWTGVRNFLRPFRGVSKWYEAQYVAVIQWCNSLKEVTDEFLRVLLGVAPSTDFAA